MCPDLQALGETQKGSRQTGALPVDAGNHHLVVHLNPDGHIPQIIMMAEEQERHHQVLGVEVPCSLNQGSRALALQTRID